MQFTSSSTSFLLRLALLLSLSLLLSACGKSGENKSENEDNPAMGKSANGEENDPKWGDMETATITYEKVALKDSTKGCEAEVVDENIGCAMIEMEVVRFTSDEFAEEADRLNSITAGLFGEEGKNFNDPEKSARAYAEFFLADQDPTTSMSGHISENWDIQVPLAHPLLTCLEVNGGGYYGGAHGLYTTQYTNVNPQSGEELPFGSQLDTTNKQLFSDIFETHYRKQNDLAPNQSLIDDGWFDNKFTTTDNIGFLKKGAVMMYNVYEVKPYAAGPSEVIVPYKALREAGLIREGSQLDELLKLSGI